MIRTFKIHSLSSFQICSTHSNSFCRASQTTKKWGSDFNFLFLPLFLIVAYLEALWMYFPDNTISAEDLLMNTFFSSLLKKKRTAKPKFNWVNVKDLLIGFIQRLMNWAASQLADRKELWRAVQNERLIGRREQDKEDSSRMNCLWQGHLPSENWEAYEGRWFHYADQVIHRLTGPRLHC